MKTKTILAAAVVVLTVLLLSGCQWLFGERLNDSQRAAAFIETANEASRNYDDMRAHFHPTSPSYSSMNTEGFWKNTAFGLDGRPFATRSLADGGELSEYPGTSSLSGTVTSPNFGESPIKFGFLIDPERPRNKLIYVILVDEFDDPIRTIH